MTELSAQRAFYDARWAQQGYANNLKLQRAAAILSALSTLKLDAPRILDVGCGTGWLTAILGRFGPTTGIELSPAAVERARALYRDVRFVAGDLADVLPAESQYDVVVSQEVLEHIADQPQHVAQLARVLRAGGYLILTTPNAAYTSHHAPESDQPIEQHLTARQLRTLLSPAFHVLSLRYIVRPYTRLQRVCPDWALKRLGYGKHLLVLAQKPERLAG